MPWYCVSLIAIVVGLTTIGGVLMTYVLWLFFGPVQSLCPARRCPREAEATEMASWVRVIARRALHAGPA